MTGYELIVGVGARRRSASSHTAPKRENIVKMDAIRSINVAGKINSIKSDHEFWLVGLAQYSKDANNVREL